MSERERERMCVSNNNFSFWWIKNAKNNSCLFHQILKEISFFPLTCFTDRFHISNDELFEVKLIFDRKTEKN